MGPVAGLAMVVFWLLLLGLLVWIVVRLLPGSDGRTSRPVGEPPLEISSGGWPTVRSTWACGRRSAVDRRRSNPYALIHVINQTAHPGPAWVLAPQPSARSAGDR